jgi:hypothetical protein
MLRSMAGKMRVHEMAKELGVSSKDVLVRLGELGEFVKSASSTLEDPVVRRLRSSDPITEEPPPENAVLHQPEALAKWTDVSGVVRACRRAHREQRPLILDFRAVRLVYPNACAPIGAILQHYKSLGVVVRAVNEPARVHSTRVLAPIEASRENLAEERIVNTVWAYFDTDGATALTEALVHHMEMTIPMETGVQQSLNICLFEVIDNVFEHSEQNSGYFMTTLTSGGTRLAVAISDTGVGALNSFRGSKHHPRNDFDALTLAIQAGVSSTGDTPRGNGLHSLQRTVENNQGRLNLRSGTGHLGIIGHSVTGGDYVSLPTIGTHNRGFYVDWQLDLRRPVRLEEVYDDLPVPVNHHLEAFENDVAEHVIYVREHDSGLGTRKAAAQLRLMLTNTLNLGAPRLVLDFEGVAVVSASFADEVIGKLAEEFGIVHFMQLFALRNMSSTIELLLNRAISLRVAQARPEAIVHEDKVDPSN